MLGSVADRRLFLPRSLRDALRMLDGEGPLVPMAGCTDLYVSLNFGTLKETRFLNLWRLAPLRTIETSGRVTTCMVRHEGEHVLTLRVSRGVPVPSRGSNVDAYSCLDGVTRRTPWTIDGTGTRMRPGGVTLVLGDHPMAKELRALGLPKRALTSGSIDTMRAAFDAAEVV